jgi:hypothetical protein
VALWLCASAQLALPCASFAEEAQGARCPNGQVETGTTCAAAPIAPVQLPAASGNEDAIDYTTPRTELAGAPLIGGNSDIGFEFGAVLTATHFGAGIEPYQWNSDLVLAASLKGGPEGAEIAQQNYLMQLDMPDAIPNRLRFTITGSFQRTINYGYYGVDNASGLTQAGRRYQFDQRDGILRTLSRIPLSKPWLLMVAANLRYVDPHAYPDSQLSDDAAAGAIRGLQTLGLGSLAFGFGYDTRDNEFFPTRGVLHQVGIKGTYAVPLSAAVGYASAGASLATYVPIAGPLVFAVRGLVDAAAGHVPFYDLALGGIFQVDELPGGPGGIRGVPIGRYRGLLKLVANAELRARVLRFHVWNTVFRLGADAFFDTGRSFRDYRFNSQGSFFAFKWGAGGGLYLQWGQAALFRAEAAYSPDASANGGFPLGVYVAQGVMF